MTPECTKDLNAIMNNLIIIGGQYKACMRDFIASGDAGVADFLRAEKMERYRLSSAVADYIQTNDKKGVVYSATPAPSHGAGTLAVLQAILTMEARSIDDIDNMIVAAAGRGSEVAKQYMVYVRNMRQKEYNEVGGVVGEIARLAPDRGAMAYYNHFLSEMYG